MKFQDLEAAFEFVSSAQPFVHSAYVSRSTGETYWRSELADLDEFPDDLDASIDYVEIPHKHDLNLGKQLVWEFVDQEIPGLRDQVHRIFSRRGAYGRFKAFLAELHLLEKWFSFEALRTKEALTRWCNNNDITIDP